MWRTRLRLKQEIVIADLTFTAVPKHFLIVKVDVWIAVMFTVTVTFSLARSSGNYARR